MKRMSAFISLLVLGVMIMGMSRPGWCYDLGMRKIEKEEKTYGIEIEYPYMTGLDKPLIQDGFNQLIKKYFDEVISEFEERSRTDFHENSPKWNMTYKYSVTYSSPRYVSLLLDGYHFWGGAHGMAVFETILFDLKTGRQLYLPDLFQADSDYLKVLSEYCIEELMDMENPDPDWIQKGAAPQKDNYEFFTIDESGLTIMFPQYQVAPYVAGVIRITIPLEHLMGVEKPGGPLEAIRRKNDK